MKTIKKLLVIGLVAVLAVSAFATQIFLPYKQANAAWSGGTTYTVAQSTTSGLANWQSEYDMGDSIAIPVVPGTWLQVTKPGNKIEYIESIADAEFTPETAGYYSVVYTLQSGTDPDFTYTPVTKEFKFYVKAENYSIEVPCNGADIPTFIIKGGKFPLPKASVVFVNSRDKVETVEDAEINVYVKDVDDPGYSHTFLNQNGTSKMEVTAPASGGKVFITYSYKIGDETIIQRDFIVTVVDTIKDNQNPVLSSSAPRTASLMTRLELNKATASDGEGEDANVKVEIFVTAPDGTDNIYTVEDHMIDKDSGYILDKYKDSSDTAKYYAAEGKKKVILDNNRDMSFYPDQKGLYVIKYKATDDSGKTAETSYNVNVEDSKDPYIKVDGKTIPAEWANSKLTVLKVDTDGNSISGTEDVYTAANDAKKDRLRLYFPKNDYIDNVSLTKNMTNNSIEISKGSDSDLFDKVTYDADGVFKSENGKVFEIGRAHV